MKYGLSHVVPLTGLLGRWQQLGTEPKVMCDTAHNREGLSIVLRQLQSMKFETLHVVIGFVVDKNLEDILQLFPSQATYYFVSADNRRSVSALELHQLAIGFGLEEKKYASVKEGKRAALKAANQEDVVYIGGSTFVVAEAIE